jgi:hypothetical protein
MTVYDNKTNETRHTYFLLNLWKGGNAGGSLFLGQAAASSSRSLFKLQQLDEQKFKVQKDAFSQLR